MFNLFLGLSGGCNAFEGPIERFDGLPCSHLGFGIMLCVCFPSAVLWCKLKLAGIFSARTRHITIQRNVKTSLEPPSYTYRLHVWDTCQGVKELELSSHLVCSLQSSWPPGSVPCITVTGRCLLFNKTGLPLQAGDRETAKCRPLLPGSAAVLGTEAEVRIGLGRQAPRTRASCSPQKAQELELRAPWLKSF